MRYEACSWRPAVVLWQRIHAVISFRGVLFPSEGTVAKRKSLSRSEASICRTYTFHPPFIHTESLVTQGVQDDQMDAEKLKDDEKKPLPPLPALMCCDAWLARGAVNIYAGKSDQMGCYCRRRLTRLFIKRRSNVPSPARFALRKIRPRPCAKQAESYGVGLQNMSIRRTGCVSYCTSFSFGAMSGDAMWRAPNALAARSCRSRSDRCPIWPNTVAAADCCLR
jgi:hypothetical protein